jgi:coenzyme PQQ precursor peptide PqqA
MVIRATLGITPIKHRWRTFMRTWKTPRVIEISVGMEINAYYCATA